MYSTTIKLKHNEIPAKIDVDTGEVTLASKEKVMPDGKELFEPDALFNKMYPASWKFLKDRLTPLEFKIAFELALMAKANTNSLEPLNDETTVNQLVDRFNIGRNKVTPLFKKLFKLGVYAKFEVFDKTKPYTKYWILNPYLIFTGKVVNSDIANLFRGTEIALNFRSTF